MRVLDLSRVLAGPLCTMILGDLGADVIKIEQPSGDDTRHWGPPFDERGESAYFLCINRNKYSVTVDLANSSGNSLFASLLQDADVVVDNFLPGSLERLGIDVPSLLDAHRNLIWCTITGFGAGSRRPGYDFVIQAESGWMAITGDPDGAPMKTGVALADLLAGKDAAIAILSSLLGRSRAGVSERRITVSLAESARAALVNVAQNALVSGSEARRWGNSHANLVPYQLFEARDRDIVIAVGNDAQWRSLIRVMNLVEFEHDATLDTNPGRLAQRDRVVTAIARRLVDRSAADWLKALDDVGVPSGIVKSVLEAIRDAAGASPLTGMPSSVAGTVRFPPPRLDEHGELIRRTGWGAFPTQGRGKQEGGFSVPFSPFPRL